MSRKLALIGYGEAGSTFARTADWGCDATGFDLLEGRREQLVKDGLVGASSAAEALARVPLVLSLVTADQVLAAAHACAAHLAPGTIWCDMNSIAPETKRKAAVVIEAAGGAFVDVAILAPVSPAGMAVPLLLSGKAAKAASDLLLEAGFSTVRVVGEEVGRASAVKMMRSIMVKGIEALTDEMMAGARAAGVVDEVLESLDMNERATPWRTRMQYNLERMATHGLRRAAEMEESARTLIALGIAPVMTRGAVQRQREAGLKGGTGEAK